MAEENGYGLFSQCRLCIVCSRQLDTKLAEEVSSVIQENGGEVVVHQSPSPLPSLNEFSHIVSSTIDFPGHDAACDSLIPVVKPQWVHISISKNKLANPRQYNPDPRLFMNDVVVCCMELPDGDKDAIIGGVLAMGGLYTSRITSSTTHLVTLTAESERCIAARNKGLKIKMVLPHWFDDCLKLGKRIDERPYMLPNPEILRLRPDAPVRITENKELIGASTPEPTSVPTQLTSPGKTRHDLDVFKSKRIMISADLKIGERLLQSIEQLITEGGGRIAQNVFESDIYVCRYREGDDYKVASRLGKDVGNLSWLYHLITHNTWTSPLRRLLHYPIARNGIPGFQGFKVSLSNYAGEARIYLENLVSAAGAECTKTLKQENTHLITAHGNSEKCNAAKEWNLHIVNHLWLEESYSKWQLQTIADPRYTHFPRRTNLTEVVGQTRIDRFAVEENFFRDDGDLTESGPSDTVMQHKDNNVPTGSAVGASTPNAKSKPNQEGIEPLGTEARTPKAPQEVKSNKKGKDKNLLTPLMSRFVAEGKENQTPSSTGSRKSKDMAAARLHEIAPDLALYEKERKRVGGVIYGGRRKSGEQAPVRKRSMEPDESSDIGEANETKKLKTTKPPIAMRVIITGYSRWVGNTKLEDADRRKLRDLGVLVVQEASRCTHLAAPSILRTLKFVTALSYAPKIITCDFLTECIDKNELLNPDEYILKDAESEKKYNISLEETCLRAQVNKHKLLQGQTIYCVENIHAGFDLFKSIIETNGGTCIMYRGRAGTILGGRRTGLEEVYLISGCEKSNGKLWTRFRDTVRAAKKVPRIVRAEWLLDIAMSQEWRQGDPFELNDEDILMKDG